MSADIINLRQARKTKSRAQKEAAASANRRKFGRTRAEKADDETARNKADHLLDGHRLAEESDQPADPDS